MNLNVLDVNDSTETVNIDYAAETPGGRLFPARIGSTNAESVRTEPSQSEPALEILPDVSIDADLVEKIINDHYNEIVQELKHPSDRSFFANLYRKNSATMGSRAPGVSEEMTDFDRYNVEVGLETKLRNRFQEILSARENGIRVNEQESLVPGEDLDFRPPRSTLFNRKILSKSHKIPQQNIGSTVDMFSNGTCAIESLENIPDLAKHDDDKQRQPLGIPYTTQRKLKSRHLQMIGFSSTIGVGLFLNSGKAFQIAGPLGCLLGYIVGGVIVLATMLSFCEMVVLIPLADGISGVTSRFIDDAFGFSAGLCYWFSFGLGLTTEIIAGTIMLSYYDTLDVPNGAQTVGWIFMFYVLVLVINLMSVKIYAEFEFYLNIIKILFTIAIVIFLIVSNRGGASKSPFLGFKYWDHNEDPDSYITYGPFRPTFDLNDNGTGSLNGIGGNIGRFLSVICASLISCYSYSGTEIPCIIAGEVKKPRQALKAASRQVFWRIGFFYFLTIFIVGISIYSGDPRLLRYATDESALANGEDVTKNKVLTQLGNSVQCYNNYDTRYWTNKSNGNQSPFVLAIQYTGYCSLASIFNGIIIVFAISCSSSHLYVSSRSLYAMARQGKAPSFLKNCWANGVPYASVMVTSAFGWLAFLVLDTKSLQIFQTLINLVSTAAILTWFGLNLAFLRFFYAMKLRPDIIARDDPQYPYRSPFQPYTAYLGLFGSLSVLLLMGCVNFLHGHWNTEFFFTSYGMWLIWIIAYFGYKWARNVKYQKLYNIDLDTGRIEIDE